MVFAALGIKPCSPRQAAFTAEASPLAGRKWSQARPRGFSSGWGIEKGIHIPRVRLRTRASLLDLAHGHGRLLNHANYSCASTNVSERYDRINNSFERFLYIVGSN